MTNEVNINDIIERARVLNENGRPDDAITLLHGYASKEIEDAGLGDLVYLLYSGQYGCSRGDVRGVIEMLTIDNKNNKDI